MPALEATSTLSAYFRRLLFVVLMFVVLSIGGPDNRGKPQIMTVKHSLSPIRCCFWLARILISQEIPSNIEEKLYKCFIYFFRETT